MNQQKQTIWSTEYRSLTFAFLSVIAIAAFGGLSVVAGLSSIAADLGQVDLLSWVITGYLAMAAIAIIIAGPVIDAIGVRRTFRATGIWFFLTSAAATVAPTMPLLVAARVAQGFGGGLIFAVAMAAVGLGYPHELRPRAFTAQSMVWGVMGLGGPAIAGAVLALTSWRMIFAVQLPLTLIALVAGWNTLPTTREQPVRIQTDWIGVALLSALIVASLVGVSQIGTRWWLVGLAFLSTLVFGVTYWVYAKQADSPVLALGHLTQLPLRWVHITSGLVMLIALGIDNYLPLYVQTTRGYSVQFSALSLLYLTAGWTTGSIIYSRVLASWREADVILSGSLLLVPSVIFSGLTIAGDWPLTLVFAAQTLVGISVGLVTTSGLTLLQSKTDPAEMGRVNSAHQFVRQLGITYGIALASTILLAVVELRVGSLEALRGVIAGDDVELGDDTKKAIRDGLAMVTVVTSVIAVGSLTAAFALARQAHSTEPAAS